MAEASDEPLAGPVDRVLGLVENATYALAGGLLVGAAVAVLVAVAYRFVVDLADGVPEAATAVLDGLLLVFILLELLAAVRATIVEHKLVAEPFLVVGIIASIKEIIVIALKAETGGGQQAFENSLAEVGVLGLLVVVLALAGFFVRRKEREPSE